MPILVDLNWPKADPQADPEAEIPLRTLRLRDQAPAGPAALAAAGVRFAFYRGESPAAGGGPRGRGASPGSSGGDIAAVRKAVERGLDREAALTALTLAPAEIFGVADRVGTLPKQGGSPTWRSRTRTFLRTGRGWKRCLWTE